MFVGYYILDKFYCAPYYIQGDVVMNNKIEYYCGNRPVRNIEWNRTSVSYLLSVIEEIGILGGEIDMDKMNQSEMRNLFQRILEGIQEKIHDLEKECNGCDENKKKELKEEIDLLNYDRKNMLFMAVHILPFVEE
jgi:hypothetical protein